MFILTTTAFHVSSAQSFEGLDADSDDKISVEEFVIGVGDNLADQSANASDPENFNRSRFEKMDLDSDKKLSEDEWTSSAGYEEKDLRADVGNFNDLDINQDGYLSYEEYDEGLKRPDKHEPGTRGKSQVKSDAPADVFEEWDENGDGFLNKEEFRKFEKYYLGK